VVTTRTVPAGDGDEARAKGQGALGYTQVQAMQLHSYRGRGAERPQHAALAA
jgi:hypothetical protein